MHGNDYFKVMRILKRYFPAKAASEKATPWESLLFTLLSARARDEQTEGVFRSLMSRYPSPTSLAKARRGDVERIVRPIGMFRSKARYVIALARRITDDFEGSIPKDIAKLVTLPGVGRKTANCVSVYAFGIPAICVDTHVHRVCNRLGWVKTRTPESTERILRESLPKRYWLHLNRVMVSFGREYCRGYRPHCWECPIRLYCAYKKKTNDPKKEKA